MNKTIITILVVLILGVATFYLYEIEEPLTEEDPYITGNIYDIGENSILVAEGVQDEDDFGIMFEGKAIWLSFLQDTRVLGNEKEHLTIEDLFVGQRVSAWIEGPIKESYPEQGSVKQIIIVGESSEVECYIGGCSAELCTNEPEAMSTCELLPGMECLHEPMSCEAVNGNCLWVLSEKAAECFLAVEKNEGSVVRESRISNFFEKAEALLK